MEIIIPVSLLRPLIVILHLSTVEKKEATLSFLTRKYGSPKVRIEMRILFVTAKNIIIKEGKRKGQ